MSTAWDRFWETKGLYRAFGWYHDGRDFHGPRIKTLYWHMA